MGKSKKGVDGEDECSDVVVEPVEGEAWGSGRSYWKEFHRGGRDSMFLSLASDGGFNRLLYSMYEELGLEEKIALFNMHAELALYHLCRAAQVASWITDDVYLVHIHGHSINMEHVLEDILHHLRKSIQSLKKITIEDTHYRLGTLKHEVEKHKKEK